MIAELLFRRIGVFLSPVVFVFALMSIDAIAQQGQSGFAYAGFSAVTRGNSVFAFGGSVLGRGSDLQTGNFRIEPTTGHVEQISSDVIFGSGTAAAEFGGLIFVSGGLATTYRQVSRNHYSSGFVDTFAAYNIAENSWTPLPILPFKVRGHCSFALDGNIYVVGGEYEYRRGMRAQYAPLAEALRYSISDRTWITIPLAAGAPATGAACTLVGNEYFIIGGSRGGGLSRQVWVWEIASNTWRQAADLPFPVGSAAAAAMGDVIVLTGGYSYEAATAPRRIDRRVWVLSPGANEWHAAGESAQGRTGHGIAVVADSVWLFGGVDEQSLRPPNYSGVLNGWWLEPVTLGFRANTEPR